MGIEEVIAKVAEGQELTAEDRETLKGWKPSVVPVKTTDNQASARARLLQKDLDEARLKLEAAEEELEHSKAGGSEKEKLQRQLERLNAKHAETEKLIESERTQHEETKRAAALAKVNIPWLDDVSAKYRDMAIEEAFEDFTVEDLGDVAKTGAVVERIISENSRFVSAPAKAGAGTGPGEGSAGQNGTFGGPKTDWHQTIDWRAVRDKDGPEGVEKMLNQMWAEPAQPK